MRTSDLGREGIEHSGSYSFADHIYRNAPSGRYLIGKLVDGVLLRLRGARSMRNRFFHTQREILRARRQHAARTRFQVLSVPCGIARDLVEAAETLRREDPQLYERTGFVGMDLDAQPLELSGRLAAPAAQFRFIQADAFDPGAYPVDLDVIVSTGFGEFLTDDELTRFCGICHDALHADGVFVSSGMQRDAVADYFARELAELHVHYRGPEQLVRLVSEAGFSRVTARPDEVGLQTLLVAHKGAGGTS